MTKLISVTDGTTLHYINPNNISYIETQEEYNLIYFTGKEHPLKVINKIGYFKKYIELFGE